MKEFGLRIYLKNISTYKVIFTSLKTFIIVLIILEIKDKEWKSWLLEKTFLFSNFSMEIVFKMLFFNSTNIEMNFLELEIVKKNNLYIKTISITKQVKWIDKKEFIIAALELEKESYIIYMTLFVTSNAYLKILNNFKGRYHYLMTLL